MRSLRYTLIAILLLALIAPEAQAGGPWTQKKGKVRLTFGYSRKASGARWGDDRVLNTPPDSTLVDGLFHDFRYGYIGGEVGITDELELSGTINYLWGYERVTRDVHTNKTVKPMWEVNSGFTDSWLNLKYRFLDGDFPLAVMVSTRFPDLYDEPHHAYARYQYRYISYSAQTKTADGRDTVVRRTDTLGDASSEWRGVLKRDLGIHLHAGHSFGDGYVQAQVAYNLREDAYADQLIFSLDGGYNIPVGTEWAVMPKLLFDYTGGVGNGALADSTDRFSAGTRNSGFNNAMYGRLYGSVLLGSADGKYGLDLGVGRWLFGRGAVQYWETYAQFSYQF